MGTRKAGLHLGVLAPGSVEGNDGVLVAGAINQSGELVLGHALSSRGAPKVRSCAGNKPMRLLSSQGQRRVLVMWPSHLDGAGGPEVGDLSLVALAAIVLDVAGVQAALLGGGVLPPPAALRNRAGIEVLVTERHDAIK